MHSKILGGYGPTAPLVPMPMFIGVVMEIKMDQILNLITEHEIRIRNWLAIH